MIGQWLNNSTVQQSNNLTIKHFNKSIIQQFNNLTIQQFRNSTNSTIQQISTWTLENINPWTLSHLNTWCFLVKLKINPTLAQALQTDERISLQYATIYSICFKTLTKHKIKITNIINHKLTGSASKSAQRTLAVLSLAKWTNLGFNGKKT